MKADSLGLKSCVICEEPSAIRGVGLCIDCFDIWFTEEEGSFSTKDDTRRLLGLTRTQLKTARQRGELVPAHYSSDRYPLYSKEQIVAYANKHNILYRNSGASRAKVEKENIELLEMSAHNDTTASFSECASDGMINTTMTAYDYLLSYNSAEMFGEYRQALVNNRGTLSNGNFASGMSIQYDQTNTQVGLLDDEDTITKKPVKVFLRVGSAQHPGIIFNKAGSEEVLSSVTSSGIFRMNETQNQKLKFMNAADTDAWEATSANNRKVCIARNFDDMFKKTDIVYRTNGDRMHYLVNGLVTIRDTKGLSHYPLFLFSCTDLNKNTLTATIEQDGFINFWLDKYRLEGAVERVNGNSIQVSLNQGYTARSNQIVAELNRLNLSSIESIEVDPTYTALAIVTGFDAEYIDPVWNEILKGAE